MIRKLARRLPYTEWGNRLCWRIVFQRSHGRAPTTENPVRFTDHLFRIKTDGRLADPLYRRITDKELAKDWIASVLGSGFTPETYAVLRTDADIDSFKPERRPCVIKPTHSSGQAMIVRDADEPIDRDTLRAWLRRDYFKASRELNYRGLTSKIIVEEFFSDGSGAIPKDYKVFCSSGIPRLVECISGRGSKKDTVSNFYDTAWDRVDCTLDYSQGEVDDARPPLLIDMLDVAARLSAPFPFVRVDLYASATEIRVGELTFCPNGAGARVKPDKADFELGKLLTS